MKHSLIRSVVLVLIFAPACALAVEPRGMVLDFGATWCGPCQQVAPVVAKLEREGLPIRTVDIDQQKALADRYHIDSVPTFVLIVDGKEVTRRSGAMSEGDIRQMIARIPQATTPPQSQPKQNSQQQNIQLGEPAELQLPRREPMDSEIRLVANEQRKSIKDLWPFGKKENAEDIVRGSDAELGEPADFAIEQNPATTFDPMQASVRIRVIIGSKINLGSGTIISSASGHTQILTCGHIFRDFNDDAKIEVDLFQNGQSKIYVARLQKFDLESDLGLISVPTENVMASAKVPDVDRHPQLAEQLAGIGCSGGENPSREQIRVTALDKYKGASTIECTGVPVQGRSGGGLFNKNGEIVGVCIAADTDSQRGLYSGLLAVHELLDACKLTALYKAIPEPQQPATSFANLDDAPVQTAANPFPEALSQAPPVTTSASVNNSMNLETGGAEVVVIIRDKSQPNAPNRVVIIHDASSKFFSYLDGELGSGTPALPLSSIARPLNNSRTTNAIASQQPRTLRTSPSHNKTTLTPTALSQPVQPKRYVRSSK